MARKLRIQYEGAIYHVTFRGNARQAIFGDDRDRERLTERVGEGAEDFGVRVYGYCWMGNHGHLLLETPAANVSAFMASVLSGYTVYYNLRHETSGHVMQGRFGSTVVSGDAYLLRRPGDGGSRTSFRICGGVKVIANRTRRPTRGICYFQG